MSMDFERLAEAVKFAAPAGETRAFLEATQRGAKTFAPDNHDHRILADFLADHDDPRELIVRRDLSYRDGNGLNGWTRNLNRHARELLGLVEGEESSEFRGREYMLPDGTTLHSRRFKNGKGHLVSWFGDSAPHFFAAPVTPEEHAQMVEKLGLRHPDS